MAGGRPTKPLTLVKGHRTKAEKSIRQAAEDALFTGIKIKESAEIKNNEVAHKEFRRLKKLFKTVQKDDDLTGNIINMHCILVAEIDELKATRIKFEQQLDDFENRLGNEEITFAEEMKIRIGLEKSIIDCDKELMKKRKLILDIAKESSMTIQSALRSIPKKEKEEANSPMADFLNKRNKG